MTEPDDWFTPPIHYVPAPSGQPLTTLTGVEFFDPLPVCSALIERVNELEQRLRRLERGSDDRRRAL